MRQLDYAAIRAQIPIRRVLELVAWTPAHQHGDQWRGPCPLRCSSSLGSECDPCFSVHVGRDLFRCFRCRQSGNQLDLWRAITHRPLYPATLQLCHRLGIPPVILGNPQPRNID